MQVATEAFAEKGTGVSLDEWIVELARHLRTYGGLPESIATALQDPDSPLCTSCQPMTNGTVKILARAKDAGAVRADVQASDLNALIGSLAWAVEQRGDSDAALPRLIKLVTDGLR